MRNSAGKNTICVKEDGSTYSDRLSGPQPGQLDQQDLSAPQLG
jgi:hypothetical protein